MCVLVASHYFIRVYFLILVPRSQNISNSLPTLLHPLAVRIQIHRILFVKFLLEIWGKFYSHGLKNTSEVNLNLLHLHSPFIYKLHTYNSVSIQAHHPMHTIPKEKKWMKNKSCNSVCCLSWLPNYKLVHQTV